MANELDETTGPTRAEGREVRVIDRQIPVTVGFGSTLFEIALWTVGTIPGILLLAFKAAPVLHALGILAAGVLPGLIFLFLKIGALAYLRQLQQRIQANASEIDNYLEQRVVILQNVVGLVERSIDLDKDVMKSVAEARGRGGAVTDAARNERAQQMDGILSRINVAFEAYPELRAHATIADAMRQNSYLQKEITAARTLYNDTVAQWNQDVFAWPTKQIVAARQGYTTRIPFTTTDEMRSQARAKFF
jgi:LemA protein